MSLQSCGGTFLESSHECNSSTVMLELNCWGTPTEAPDPVWTCKYKYKIDFVLSAVTDLGVVRLLKLLALITKMDSVY